MCICFFLLHHLVHVLQELTFVAGFCWARRISGRTCTVFVQVDVNSKAALADAVRREAAPKRLHVELGVLFDQSFQFAARIRYAAVEERMHVLDFVFRERRRHDASQSFPLIVAGDEQHAVQHRMAGGELSPIHERAGLLEEHLLDQVQIVHTQRGVARSKASAKG